MLKFRHAKRVLEEDKDWTWRGVGTLQGSSKIIELFRVTLKVIKKPILPE